MDCGKETNKKCISVEEKNHKTSMMTWIRCILVEGNESKINVVLPVNLTLLLNLDLDFLVLFLCNDHYKIPCSIGLLLLHFLVSRTDAFTPHFYSDSLKFKSGVLMNYDHSHLLQKTCTCYSTPQTLKTKYDNYEGWKKIYIDTKR